MCVICFKKSNAKPITEDVFRRCWERNCNGGGMAYLKDKEIIVEKGYFNVNNFWNDFNAIQNERMVLLHFRKASAGNIDIDNCHPWIINKDFVMAHNGTLGLFIDPESTMSDTGLYNKLVLKPLFKKYPHFWKSKYGHFLLASSMGYSKMVILSNSGEYLILNEPEGIWEDDEKVWFSNDGYKEESEYFRTCFPRQLWLNFPQQEQVGDLVGTT